MLKQLYEIGPRTGIVAFLYANLIFNAWRVVVESSCSLNPSSGAQQQSVGSNPDHDTCALELLRKKLGRYM